MPQKPVEAVPAGQPPPGALLIPALLDELAAFATDTTEHVRKENEILFPAALNLAQAQDA